MFHSRSIHWFFKRILNQKKIWISKRKTKRNTNVIYTENWPEKNCMKENITSRIIIFSVCLSQSIYVWSCLFLIAIEAKKHSWFIHLIDVFVFVFVLKKDSFLAKGNNLFVCLCRLVCQWNHCRLCSEWMECVIVESNANKQKVFHLLSSLDMMMFIKFFLKSD